MDKINVLYIDDESSNLSAFKASFRRVFNVHIASNAQEGYTIIENNPIEVIVADQRMPETTGVDFFASILESYPNPMRILLTGYSDINNVIEAINKGHIYHYITKPWNEDQLKITINNAYQVYQLREQRDALSIKYEKVFSESTDPIVLFDLDGKITDYNNVTLDLLQAHDDTLDFATFDSIFNVKEDVDAIMKAIAENNFIKDYECQIISKKQVIRNCLISCNTLKDNYGNITNYQAIIKDITERSRINQLLLKTTIETQEQERERISRDLHDGLGQSLAAMKLHIEALRFADPNNIITDVDKLTERLQGTIKELRQICFNTLPQVLYDYGLINATNELIIRSTATNFKIHFSVPDDFPRMNKMVEIAIYRIIQEALNNIIKHSKATETIINLTVENDSLSLEINDNGIGFDLNDPKFKKGYGMQNIKARINLFNGTTSIDSVLNQGTTVKINIPNVKN